MKLPAGLAGAAATASTVALNFWPWLVAAAVLGAAPASYATFKVTRAFYRGEALEARLQLSKFTETQATQAAMTERNVSDLLTQRAAEQKARDDAAAARDAAISARIAALPDQVASHLQPDLLAFRSILSADPNLACLDLPLPPGALRLLERPGGPVPAQNR